MGPHDCEGFLWMGEKQQPNKKDKNELGKYTKDLLV